MIALPDDGMSVSEQSTMDRICRHLGVKGEDLLRDPVFRKEIGAEELDRLENILEQEQADA
jgi:hypothetical protein